jgi:hypothetical protein
MSVLTWGWARRPQAFTLIPNAAMRHALERDYMAMSGMIFGDIPPLDAVLISVAAARSDQWIAAMDRREAAGR